MPIALLKFPTDLLRDVLKQCNPFELYCLSKCSKRVRNSVKLGGERNWKISYRGWNEINISGDGRKYHFYCTKNPEDYFKTEHARNYKSMKIPMEGGATFFYLLETFGICIVESLEIQSGNLYNFLQITKVLIERNMEIENFCIGKTLDLKDVVNVMPLISQMNITKEFECLPMLPPNFHCQLTTFPNCIRIYNSVWFDVSQLLNCTCTRIELADSGLCNQDLNVFLQKWKKTRAFPNLQWLKVESKNMDNRSAILDMVPPIMNMENPRQQVSIQFDKNDYVNIYDAVRIYKDDGREAWLRVRLGGVPKLEFLVSNPDNTKVKEGDLSDDEEE